MRVCLKHYVGTQHIDIKFMASLSRKYWEWKTFPSYQILVKYLGKFLGRARRRGRGDFASIFSVWTFSRTLSNKLSHGGRQKLIPFELHLQKKVFILLSPLISLSCTCATVQLSISLFTPLLPWKYCQQLLLIQITFSPWPSVNLPGRGKWFLIYIFAIIFHFLCRIFCLDRVTFPHLVFNGPHWPLNSQSALS